MGADLKLRAHGLQDLLGFGVFGGDEENRNNLAFRALDMAKASKRMAVSVGR